MIRRYLVKNAGITLSEDRMKLKLLVTKNQRRHFFSGTRTMTLKISVLKNIGFEDEDAMYDDEGEYIGKGPTGYYELAQVVSEVAKELREQQVITNTLKKSFLLSFMI